MSNLKEISQQIRSQDTSKIKFPIYVLETPHRIITRDGGLSMWVNGGFEEVDKETSWKLDVLLAESLEEDLEDAIDSISLVLDGVKYYNYFYEDSWSFVTACLTMEAVRRFVEENGRLYGKLKVSSHSLSGNQEMLAIRDHLLDLTAADN